MQDPGKGTTESELAATETSLGRCLVDGDAATKSRDFRRRRKALGISLAIEATVLALLVVVPIMSSVAQPHFKATVFVPIAFGGSPVRTSVQHPAPGSHRPGTSSNHPIIFTMGQPASRITDNREETNESPFPDSDFSLDPFNHDGPLISGFRPTDPVVRPPDDKKKLEEKHAVKISEPLQQAQLIARIEPRYPVLAVQTRKEGTVVLHAIISRDGRITALEVVSGPPLLVPAAVDAVRQWRYRPTVLNGEPVEVDTSITVIFRLSQ